VEGPFKITVPLLHMGYLKSPGQSTMYIFATLDPILPAPPVRPSDFQFRYVCTTSSPLDRLFVFGLIKRQMTCMVGL
jgi:hypothetical protein